MTSKDAFFIFQTENPSENDYKRKQLNLESRYGNNDRSTLSEVFQKVNELFKPASKFKNQNSKRKGSALLSLEKCQKQAYHMDNDTSTNKKYTAAKDSFICILSLQEETYLYCYEKDLQTIKKIKIPPGSLFIARGIFVHAGSDYKVPNIRLHFYMDAPGNVRKGNDATYIFNYRQYKEQYERIKKDGNLMKLDAIIKKKSKLKKRMNVLNLCKLKIVSKTLF